MTLRYSTDIVIFGGGVAGLWLLNRLINDGYHPLLFETGALGGGQTLASQGIIHGGLKYALSGTLTGAANVIAGMPAYWRSCLSGKGDLDLTGVPILCDHYYMWSDGSLRSKLKTFLGSKSLVGRVEAIARSDYPEFFSHESAEGTLYKLPDFVVDTDELLKRLASTVTNNLFALDEGNYQFTKNPANGKCHLLISCKDKLIEIADEQFVFCAGEGNAKFIEQTGIESAAAQIRPLHMVYLKQVNLPQLFVHCVGDDFSLTPKLTVTSHTDIHGQTVWYLGGDLAEKGVNKDSETQIAAAQHLLAKLFPWIDTSEASWGSFLINRAEANIKNNYRPDDAFIASESNMIFAWPTKLTLTPSMADKVVNTIKEESTTAIDSSDALNTLRELLDKPEAASAYWN